MTQIPEDHPPRLVDSLARVSRRHRVARKLIVAPNFAAGRELVRRLSISGQGWIGFEVTTPHRLAQRLALSKLETDGVRQLDMFEQQALLDEALDSVVPAEESVLAELSERVGFRTRVHGAINALRLAGVGPNDLEAVHFAQWEKKRFLLRVLRRYERLLGERRRADTARILGVALEALDEAGSRIPPIVDAEVVVLLPGLGTRGLQGRLIAALAARGAKVLATDPVLGLEAPDTLLEGRNGPPTATSYLYAPEAAPTSAPIQLFSASSIEAELREVLRRAASEGFRWDEVEIVASDAAVYGSALHALGSRLGIPVTYAVGLPIARTRTGRVVRAYLDWIEEGFQAHVIRRLLESGDLRPPRSHGRHAPAALARRFRGLRVGWGRQRYRTQIRNALAGLEDAEPGRHESPERFERRRDRARTELKALRSILFPALKETPAVPDRMGDDSASVSPAELARGLEAFLRRVPRGRGPDAAAREEVGRILERVTATLHRRTEFRAAVSILRAYLDVRVRPDIAGDEPDGAGAPWSSRGGALHLSDLEHGGYTGRKAVFLVGMDAERIPGGGHQDPVLLDSDRRVLGHDLPTSAELLRDRIYRFAALVARLRGRVTMSFGAWQASEARTVGPSSVLLQALRLSRRDATPTFGDLYRALGRVVSAVPAPGARLLDSDDYWMRALGSGVVLRGGSSAVRAAFPELGSGLAAAEARREGQPGAVHGVIEPRPEAFDPRRNGDLVVSASRLEALGACPLRYLHSSVLRVAPPDDPKLDPDAWLDPRERGSLLHAVYDATLRESKAKGLRVDEPGFEELALERLAEGVEKLQAELPVPGEGTLTRETAALQEDVRSFVRLIRRQAPQYAALELRFGLGDDEPVLLDLGVGPLRLRGAIDRVDQDLSGLHVIDYKTGAPHGYESGTFNGGRRLQHALYAHVAEARLQNDVVDGQYHFPTRRGQNQTFTFPRNALTPVRDLLTIMLDGVSHGHFVPTDDPNDCTFCDYAEVCRARRGSWGKIDSPLAVWSEEHANAGIQPAFAHLKRTRTFDD